MVATVLFLVMFGLVMVLSSSFVDSALGNNGNFFAVFLRQAMWVLMGLPVMLLLARVPPIAFLQAAPAGLLGALVLQSLVFTPLGVSSGGNRNWIAIGSFSGQPSEVLKVALIVWMAAILSRRLEVMGEFRTLRKPLGVGVIASISLVMAGGDLGTVGVMALVVVGVVFLAGIRLRHLAGILSVVVGLGALGALFYSFPGEQDLAPGFPVAPMRITSRPVGKPCTPPLHWVREEFSVWAWGNSRAKWSWLPEAETDFIFAIVGEELGLLGAGLVILCFVVLAVTMAHLVRKNPDPFARLVTAGVMVWLIGQALINIAVVLELLPVLGIPLPFMSVGGSALLSSLAAVGIVMALNRSGAVSVTEHFSRLHGNRR